MEHYASPYIVTALTAYPSQANVDAELAQLDGGLDLRVSGPSSSAAAVVEYMLAPVCSGEAVSDDAFQAAKAAVVLDVENRAFAAAYRQAVSHLRRALRRDAWADAEVLSHVAAATVADVHASVAALCCAELDVLVHGNVAEDGAQTLADAAVAGLAGASCPNGGSGAHAFRRRMCARLDDPQVVVVANNTSGDDTNTAVLAYVQVSGAEGWEEVVAEERLTSTMGLAAALRLALSCCNLAHPHMHSRGRHGRRPSGVR